MRVEEVEKRVAEIRACAGDDETAHSMEDELHQDVLREIARQGREPGGDGSSSPFALAEAALKTLEIEFARWCA